MSKTLSFFKEFFYFLYFSKDFLYSYMNFNFG
jgi:hypothetical protein